MFGTSEKMSFSITEPCLLNLHSTTKSLFIIPGLKTKTSFSYNIDDRPLNSLIRPARVRNPIPHREWKTRFSSQFPFALGVSNSNVGMLPKIPLHILKVSLSFNKSVVAGATVIILRYVKSAFKRSNFGRLSLLSSSINLIL